MEYLVAAYMRQYSKTWFTNGAGLSRNILCVVLRVTMYVDPGTICLGADILSFLSG